MTPGGPASQTNPWISSAVTDVFFMFGGVLFAVVIFIIDLLNPIGRADFRTLIILITMVLQGGHTMAPFLLLLCSRRERSRAVARDPKLWRRLTLILACPLVLYAVAALIFTYEPHETSVINLQRPIAVMGAIWFFWNAWHFGMQHFGVLQLYRAKTRASSQAWRRYDFWLIMTVGGLVPMMIYASAGSADFIETFFGGRPQFDPLMKILGALVAFVAIGTFAGLIRSRMFRWPLIFAYTSLFVQVWLVWYMPGAFIVVAWCFNHWLQEIFLVSHLYAKDRTENQQPAKTYVPFLGALFVLGGTSLVYSAFFELGLLKKHSFSFSGKFRNFAELTPTLFWTIAGIFAVAMFFASGHFYIDRIIHKGRRW